VNNLSCDINPERVAIATGAGKYGDAPPFGPDTSFPEYAFGKKGMCGSNPAYASVRESFALLGLDSSNYGTPEWNPLGDLIRPGETVVLKPNFVRHLHEKEERGIECIITSGSILRAVLDYVAIALRGNGRVVVSDAPQCESRFEEIAAFTGLYDIRSFYRDHSDIQIDIVDLRREYTEKVDGVIIGHRELPGDPAGYTVVDLGRDSAFMPVNQYNDRLYGSEYDRSEVADHHHGDVHEYLISRTIMDADVYINLPKLKTHKKVGVTLNLKNLVGINGNKNWLPHHREGVPANGGDQYADSGVSERLERVLLAGFKRVFPMLGPLRKYVGGVAKKTGRAAFGDTETSRIRSGNWYGNDTTWRMVLDLNRALRYADGEGCLHDTPRRRYFSVVDGVVAGEGNGPMGCDARNAGVVVAGIDALAVDLACARIMGFDYRKIPTLLQALAPHRYPMGTVPYGQVQCLSNEQAYNRRLAEIVGSCLAFNPHFGWVGHLEVDSKEDLVEV
jgi:uncharacterized protein (DUF362 family)